MAVTLKKQAFYIRDGQEYTDPGLFISDVPAVVEAVGEQQRELVQDKGDEVIASIPQDYTTLSEDVSDLKSAFDEVTDYQIVGLNLFDPTTAVSGYYKRYTDGADIENTNFFYGFFDCEPNTKYMPSRTSGVAYTNGHVCFYDDSDNFLSGVLTSGTGVITTPANCYRVYFSEELIRLNAFKWEIGDTVTEFVKYLCPPYLTVERKEPFVLTPSDGVGSLWKIIKLAGVMANKNNPVVVEIPEGTYSISPSIYTDPTYGIFVPDYVTLKGLGRKTHVIIKCDLDTQSSTVSALNLSNTSGLENLTVVGINTRYALHDDFADNDNEEYLRTVKNCIFNVSNGYYGPAYGLGTKQGGHFTFENCDFITNKAQSAFLAHSNSDFDIPCSIKFDSCNFVSRGQTYTVNIVGHASMQLNSVEFVGCNVSGIKLNESSSGVGIDWELRGHGNNNCVVNAPTDYEYYFEDEVIWLYDQYSQGKGYPVIRNNSLALKATQDYRFFGVTVGSANDNGCIKVKHKGYINAPMCGIIGLTVGVKVYLDTTNSVLTTTDTGHVVGICDETDFFRLI